MLDELNFVAHATGCAALACDPTGLWSGGEEGRVRCWATSCAHASRLSLRAHSGRVTVLRLCPSGRVVATGGADRSVKLHASDTGAPLAVFRAHAAWVSSLLFSPDGERLFSGSYDGDVRVFDVPARRALATLPARAAHPAPPQHGAFTGPPERMVASLWLMDGGGDDATDARDAPRDAPHSAAEPPPPSPPHRLVAASMDGVLSVWDVGTAALLGRVATGSAVTCVGALAPPAPGRPRLMYTTHRDGAVRAWRAAAGGGGDGGGDVESDEDAPPPLALAWSLDRAHGDWANGGVLHPSCGGAVLLTGGEDGRLSSWRVGCPLPWSRASHAAFSDGFRAATVAFLHVLRLLGEQPPAAAQRRGSAPTSHAGARTPSGCAGRGGRAPASADCARASSAATQLSPVSPSPVAAQRRRGRSASVSPWAGTPPEAERRAPFRAAFHGATRDALIDLVLGALSQSVADLQHANG